MVIAVEEEHSSNSDSDLPTWDDTVEYAKAPRSHDSARESEFSFRGSGEQVVRYFGEYELQHEIGRGGMGVVFKARQRKLNRIVALKMILAGVFADSEQIERFAIEARAVAKLDHPDIVPIFEVGEHDGYHFYSMGYVNGHSLKEELSEGPFEVRRAAEIVARIASAVAYANSNKIIHRDLKPANILIAEDDRIRVADFGLAKEIGARDLTSTGRVMGTPNYMAPEQAKGNNSNVNSTSDVYAIGAILYELLTGRPPFQAAAPLDILSQILTTEPVPPRRLNPTVPRDLENICLKCLEKDQRRRYETGQLLAKDIQRWIEGYPVEAKATSFLLRTAKWAMRNPAWAATGGMLAILFCTFSMMAITNIDAYIEASGQSLIVVLVCCFFAGLLNLLLLRKVAGESLSRSETMTLWLCLSAFFVGGIGLLSLPITFLLHFLK